MRRLSPQQQQILVHVYRKVQEADQTTLTPGVVPWGTEGDRTFQASASRSLRRLEAHGLLQRLHATAGRARALPEATQHRTTHVCLLPAGLVLAQRLTAGC
jgi:hypothetical protein